MQYNIHYDIAALAVIAVVLVHFVSKKSVETIQRKVFCVLLLTAFLSDLLDIVTVLLRPETTAVWEGYLINCGYLILFNSSPAVYYLYLLLNIKNRNEITVAEKFTFWVPFAIVFTMIVMTPLTHLIFIYDKQGYRHGPGFSALYVVAFCYMFMSLLLSVYYRKKMTFGQKASVYCYNGMCLFAIVAQMQYPKLLLLQFVFSISVMLAYLSLENPMNDLDNALGIYNRTGFLKWIHTSINDGREFRLIGVNLIGYQSVRETLGVDSCEMFLRQVVESLLPKIRPMRMFSIAQGQFVLATDNPLLKLDEIIECIQAEYRNPVQFQEIEVGIGAYLYQIDYPQTAQNAEDIMDIIDYSADLALASNDGVIMHASEEILWKKRRENKIEQALQHAIRENGFGVHYQPIYSVKDKCYRSAEALVRLQDEELGFISPEEFIPMAEKNGMILDIGEYVFRSVCSMMASERLWEKGIRYIEVNLSVVQCMQEKLHQRLLDIMKEYGVPSHCINLEITETAAVVSKETLLQNMERLIARDVTFSLDDYGTGYSNISNIIKYPFRIIKLDKSMIWTAMEDERATQVLAHTVAMLKDLGLFIVAEGVENEKQAQILEEMGCDFFQGYYYSKPVPVADFLKKIG